MKGTKVVTAKGIRTDSNGLTILLDDRQVLIPWERCSTRIANARAQDRLTAQLSPGGYGVHWPLVDEDLTVHGLLMRE